MNIFGLRAVRLRGRRLCLTVGIASERLPYLAALLTLPAAAGALCAILAPKKRVFALPLARTRHTNVPPMSPSLLPGLRFENLGLLPRTEQERLVQPYAQVAYVSPEGDVVAGTATTDVGDKSKNEGYIVEHAFVWTQQEGLTDLGETLGRKQTSKIVGASADGATLIGWWADSRSQHPFLRTADGKLLQTAVFRGEAVRHPEDRPIWSSLDVVSTDGSYVIGETEWKPFLLSCEQGAEDVPAGILEGPLDLGHEIAMLGPKAQWCVGESLGEAYVWTAACGRTNIDPLPGDSGSQAYAATDDGRVVVGTSGNTLFRWTAEQGMESLGEFTAYSRSGTEQKFGSISVKSTHGQKGRRNRFIVTDGRFFRVAADGQTIAGIKASQAFVWREGYGLRDLTELLRKAGASSEFINLPVRAVALAPAGDYVTGISEDHRSNLVRWRLHL